MAGRTDIDLERAAGRSGLDHITACTFYSGIFVLGMNTFSHDSLPRLPAGLQIPVQKRDVFYP